MDDTTRTELESVIRGLAGTVLSLVATRRAHPSYGVTLTEIRNAGQRMSGAIGAYMVLDRQATHPNVVALAEFTETNTTDTVRRARAALDSL